MRAAMEARLAATWLLVAWGTGLAWPANKEIRGLANGFIKANRDLEVDPGTAPPPSSFHMPSQSEILLTIFMVGALIFAVLYAIYLLRDVLRPCIEFMEKSMELIVKVLVWPVNKVLGCVKDTIYPVKQCIYLSFEHMDYTMHPWKRTT